MVEFEWDDKNRRNIAKHGWDFVRAARVFGDPFGIVQEHRTIAYDELRFRITGIVDGQLVTVIDTERVDVLRLISARKATSHERKTYQGLSR
jgi:uncharacterized DUF497 family protein